MADTRKLHVNVRYEGGSMWATIDEMPGVFATGDTLDELRESLEEGVALMLAPQSGPLPTVTMGSFELPSTSATATTELEYA